MRRAVFMNPCPHGGPDVHPRPDPRARGPCPGNGPNPAQGRRRRSPHDDPALGLQARPSGPGTDRVPNPRHRPPDRCQDDPGRTRGASKKSYQGSSMICPQCRDVAAFKDHRDKSFTTLLGDAWLEVRPYYHCSHCHRGHFPGDAALGLTGRRISRGAEEVITQGGTLTNFAEAATKLLPKMAGLRFSESTVERTTEANGQRLGRLREQGQALGPARDWDWNRDARGQTVAYVSVDATGVGQQGPGGAKAEGKMVSVGMVFNAAEFKPESPRDAQPIEQARYLAGLIDLDTLGAQLRRQAGQVGMDRAEQWIGLSDGGNGLDEFLTVNFPRATLILDFSHAAEHLDDLAKAWSDTTAGAESLLDDWRHQMRAEGGAAVLRTLEALDRS